MAKKLYTLLDQNDFVMHAAFFEEGQQPVNAVPELVTTFMVKPKFIRASRTYQETATQAQIDAKLLEINPPTTQYWVDAGDGKLKPVTITNSVFTVVEPNQ